MKQVFVIFILTQTLLANGLVEQTFNSWRHQLGGNVVGLNSEEMKQSSDNIYNALTTGKAGPFKKFANRSATASEQEAMMKAIIMQGIFKPISGTSTNALKPVFTESAPHTAQRLKPYDSINQESRTQEQKVELHLAITEAYLKLSEHIWHKYIGDYEPKDMFSEQAINDAITEYADQLKDFGISNPSKYLRLNIFAEYFFDVIKENNGLLIKYSEDLVNSDIIITIDSSTGTDNSGFNNAKYYHTKQAFEFDRQTSANTILGIFKPLDKSSNAFQNVATSIISHYLKLIGKYQAALKPPHATAVVDLQGLKDSIREAEKNLFTLNTQASNDTRKSNILNNVLFMLTTGTDRPFINQDLSKELLFDKGIKQAAGWHAINALMVSHQLDATAGKELEQGEILPEHRNLITRLRAHAIKAVGAFKNPALNFMVSFALRRAELVRALDRGQANQNFLRDYMNPVLDTSKSHSKFSHRTATSVYKVSQKGLNPNEIEHITKLGAFVEGFHTILEYPTRSADNIRRVTFAKLREADHYEDSDNGDRRYHQKPDDMTNKLQNIQDTSLLEDYEIQQTKDWFEAVSQKGSYQKMIQNIYYWSTEILKHTKVYAAYKDKTPIEFFSFPTAALGNCGFYTNSLETRCHKMGNIRILNLFKGNLNYIKQNRDAIFKKVKQFIDDIKNDQYKRSAHSSKRSWGSFEALVNNEEFLSGLMGKNWKAGDYNGNLIDKLDDGNLENKLVKKNASYTSSALNDWYAYAEEKELVLSWLLDFIPVAWHVTNKAAHQVESFGLPVASPDSPQKHLYASGGAIHDMKMSKADPENIIDIVYGLRVALDDKGASILNKAGHTEPFNSWFAK